MKVADHGGRVVEASRMLGLPLEAILDFSASINPLGMPQVVKEAAYRGVDRSIHYPEADADTLRTGLAAHFNVPASVLLPGAGATDLLYRVFRILGVQQALVVRPAFAEYARAIRIAGGQVRPLDLAPENGFRLDRYALLHALDPSTDWVVLANPGNPTGAGISLDDMRQLVDDLPSTVRLFVDESFADFCPHGSLLPSLAGHPRLFILRSLTKFYALPGLRVGFLVGPSKDLAEIADRSEPWTLCAPGQEAACACLGVLDFVVETLEKVRRWRSELHTGLASLGLEVFPSVANYLLVRLGENVDARTLTHALFTQGILLRSCATFAPLSDRFLRIAVRTATENQRLIDALAPFILGTRNRST